MRHHLLIGRGAQGSLVIVLWACDFCAGLTVPSRCIQYQPRHSAGHLRPYVPHILHEAPFKNSAESVSASESAAATGMESEVSVQADDFTPRTDDESLDIDADMDIRLLLNRDRDAVENGDVSVVRSISNGKQGEAQLAALLTLPRHSHSGVNRVLTKTEKVLRLLHKDAKEKVDLQAIKKAKEVGRDHEMVYANNYVDLGKIDTVGFDFDYTLVTYTDELLELIYDKALQRLVSNRQYPLEMLDSGLQYDPFFSIRGLAVDKQKGWITHLSYTHKVAVAWEGREKLPTSRIYKEYRGKRALRPAERRQRLKPLNDIFSMAECCLIADTVQFFKDRNIPYAPQNVVTDVLQAVTDTHLSGEFHRLVANDPDRYFDPTPHLKQVIQNLKAAGKRLIFVSNSPFWYVDAGMRYVFGGEWRKEWDAIITSAGKPNFYTDESRPFREICQETRRIMFKQVEKFEKGKVYTEGCVRELTRLMDWDTEARFKRNIQFGITSGSHDVATANVLYIGDSLFADLVDAKREFGWTTAAVTPEVGYELELQELPEFAEAQKSINLLLHALRKVQEELGPNSRSEEDIAVLDQLERLVSMWRDRETSLLGNSFGSVFRARYQPSLFAQSLRRYCDLYMTSVSSLRHFSCDHRFYPDRNHKLLAHEISEGPECLLLDEEVVDAD